MKLEALAEYLEDNMIAREGRDLFVHFMPHNIKKGILLMNHITGAKVDPYILGYRRSKFRIVVRHPDRLEGDRYCWEVTDALTMDRKILTGIEVKFIRPIHDPIVFPYSEGRALEFSVNFESVYALTT